MIGEKVKYRKYRDSRETLNGVILEKYLGIKTCTQNFPSGRGGTISVDNHMISIDIYIIKKEKLEYLDHIPCDHIEEIITKS